MPVYSKLLVIWHPSIQNSHATDKNFKELIIFTKLPKKQDHSCGLVVRVPSYRPRGPGFHSQALPDFLRSNGCGTGPFSLMRITDEIPEWKSSGSSLENRD
jgi:hypothetical protein